MLGFQSLDVYQCAIRILAASCTLAARIPRGYSELADQFRRAALSVPLNIAEGSGKTDRDALRFYSTARGSALECAAVLDAMEALGFVDNQELAEARELLERTVAMLSRLRQ
jgi:four helix bundle protein